MRKIYLLIVLLLILFILSSCGSDLLQAETSQTTINELQNDYDKLKADYEDLTEQNIRYNDLIDNLNVLLSSVYYGYSNNENFENEFTAFSLNYNDKYYLITVGHAVEQDGQKYTDFKFKPNFSDEWIYPELLTYKFDYDNKRTTLSYDYAIFYSNIIADGLIPEIDRDFPEFVLGNCKFNIVRNNGTAIPGESGSPIINLDGEVTGMLSAPFTDIDIILQAIDELN
jgi:hypothetical protein